MNNNLLRCAQWVKDIDLANSRSPFIGALKGKTIFITGATGLICSALADMLIRFDQTDDAQIRVLLGGRSYSKAQSRFGEALDGDLVRWVPYDAGDLSRDLSRTLDVPCDYIIHGAGNAYPKLVMAEPAETLVNNVLGMSRLLEYARDTKVQRILYISSSEIYGRSESADPFLEDDYGFIDVLNPRNAYSCSKRTAETLCACYLKEYGVDSVIVRPGHIYGPTASPSDNRVSSAFAYLAAEKQDIVLKSAGTQLRSYCYCLDCASAMLKVLLSGENCHAYNISNPNSIINIKQMAEILAAAGNVELKMELPTEAEKKSFNPMTNSSLESQSLISLGWRGCFTAEDGLGHTVAILKSVYGY
jgi:nucleoside-diphosphate-sugar epimerase